MIKIFNSFIFNFCFYNQFSTAMWQQVVKIFKMLWQSKSIGVKYQAVVSTGVISQKHFPSFRLGKLAFGNFFKFLFPTLEIGFKQCRSSTN